MHQAHPTDQLVTVQDLGRIAYEPALARQRQLNEDVAAGRRGPTLLLLEHEPVITVSHRRGTADHLLVSQQQLARMGIQLCQTDRGGDITYHGPGQLVAYPLLRLNPLGLNLGRYMRWLEELVIETVAELGVAARRVPGCTGVWVDGPHGPEKLCALGVRVRRNTTMHGLALNVDCDMEHFQTIVPCGLADRGVTSLARLMGQQAPSMETVKQTLATRFRAGIQNSGFKMQNAEGSCPTRPLDHSTTRPLDHSTTRPLDHSTTSPHVTISAGSPKASSNTNWLSGIRWRGARSCSCNCSGSWLGSPA